MQLPDYVNTDCCQDQAHRQRHQNHCRHHQQHYMLTSQAAACLGIYTGRHITWLRYTRQDTFPSDIELVHSLWSDSKLGAQTHLGETQNALVSSVMHKVGIFHAIPGICQGQAHGISCVLLHCLGQRLEVACMVDQ